jgi:hypothetical protein
MHHALAQEGGPFFFGGVYGMLPGSIGVLDGITEAFPNGGGVKQAQYDPRFWDGLERFSRGSFGAFDADASSSWRFVPASERSELALPEPERR